MNYQESATTVVTFLLLLLWLGRAALSAVAIWREHTAGRQNKTFEAKLAINASGVITGSFFDQNGVAHGFVRIQ